MDFSREVKWVKTLTELTLKFHFRIIDRRCSKAKKKKSIERKINENKLFNLFKFGYAGYEVSFERRHFCSH